MINLVIFGAPGAGKGTQAEFLVKNFNLKHISTGDVFRRNIKEGTALGSLAKSYIDKGELVPDKVTIDMLADAVNSGPDAKGFIFDGFPRTVAQAEALDTLLKSKGAEVTAVLSLDGDDEILVQRIVERGKASGRADDQDERIIRNRLKEYYDKTNPVKHHYERQKKHHVVNGIGAIEEIALKLKETVEKLIK